jgi:hypothetical protein
MRYLNCNIVCTFPVANILACRLFCINGRHHAFHPVVFWQRAHSQEYLNSSLRRSDCRSLEQITRGRGSYTLRKYDTHSTTHRLMVPARVNGNNGAICTVHSIFCFSFPFPRLSPLVAIILLFLRFLFVLVYMSHLHIQDDSEL